MVEEKKQRLTPIRLRSDIKAAFAPFGERITAGNVDKELIAQVRMQISQVLAKYVEEKLASKVPRFELEFFPGGLGFSFAQEEFEAAYGFPLDEFTQCLSPDELLTDEELRTEIVSSDERLRARSTPLLLTFDEWTEIAATMIATAAKMERNNHHHTRLALAFQSIIEQLALGGCRSFAQALEAHWNAAHSLVALARSKKESPDGPDEGLH